MVLFGPAVQYVAASYGEFMEGRIHVQVEKTLPRAAGRSEADRDFVRLMVRLLMILRLFASEFQQPGLAFRLGDVLQRKRTGQAIFIKRSLLGVGFLEGFGLRAFQFASEIPAWTARG